ncbi:MAG: 4'-phosphopantetheinyl transferase superfamily protein [Chloroflexota bacterium]
MNDDLIWHPSPDTWTLDATIVHLWSVELDQPADVRAKFWKTLNDDERTRANRFYFDHDRHHFIVARGVLRQLLANYLGIFPVNVVFDYGHNGKPLLDQQHHNNGRILEFNLSHAKGVGVIGFAWDRIVGVDVEKIRPLDDGPNIAKRFFSKSENEIFFSLPESEYPHAFFNCWTRKEAFIKAIGDGLTYPLDKFDVTLTPGKPARLISVEGSTAKAERWHLVSFFPMKDYVGALIAEGKNWTIKAFKW